MAAQRANEHEAKLTAARTALNNYANLTDTGRAKYGKHWKREVAKRATQLLRGPLRGRHQITATFITRALSAGELELPSELR